MFDNLFLYILSDRKLCHSTSKSIGDEDDTLKSFMVFNITPRESVFRVIVGSQIMILNIIFVLHVLGARNKRIEN